MNLIPDQLTNLTPQQALVAFRDAFAAVFGKAPSNSTLAILVAQSALETSRWRSMHDFNFGNSRPTADTPDYCQFRCNEVINGKIVWYDPPSPGSNFAAFPDAMTGATFFMQLLGKRYPEAYQAALAGQAAQFVDGLKQRDYFTADEGPYVKAVTSMCTEFFAIIAHGLDSDTPHDVPPHEPDWDTLRAAVAAQQFDLSHEDTDDEPTNPRASA